MNTRTIALAAYAKAEKAVSAAYTSEVVFNKRYLNDLDNYDRMEGVYFFDTIIPLQIGTTYIVTIDGVKYRATPRRNSINEEDQELVMDCGNCVITYNPEGLQEIFGRDEHACIANLKMSDDFVWIPLELTIETEPAANFVEVDVTLDDGTMAKYRLFGQVVQE